MEDTQPADGRPTRGGNGHPGPGREAPSRAREEPPNRREGRSHRTQERVARRAPSGPPGASGAPGPALDDAGRDFGTDRRPHPGAADHRSTPPGRSTGRVTGVDRRSPQRWMTPSGVDHRSPRPGPRSSGGCGQPITSSRAGGGRRLTGGRRQLAARPDTTSPGDVSGQPASGSWPRSGQLAPRGATAPARCPAPTARPPTEIVKVSPPARAGTTVPDRAAANQGSAGPAAPRPGGRFSPPAQGRPIRTGRSGR